MTLHMQGTSPTEPAEFQYYIRESTSHLFHLEPNILVDP
jgi:hypothetical protein